MRWISNTFTCKSHLVRLVLLLASASVIGCTGSAQESLLVATTQAVEQCETADETLERALMQKNDKDKQALDAAFLSDLKGLASTDNEIAYDDVVQAKALYDQRLRQIAGSRRNIESFFANKLRLHEIVLDLIRKARDLSARDEHMLQEAINALDILKQLKTSASAETTQ